MGWGLVPLFPGGKEGKSNEDEMGSGRVNEVGFLGLGMIVF